MSQNLTIRRVGGAIQLWDKHPALILAIRLSYCEGTGKVEDLSGARLCGAQRPCRDKLSKSGIPPTALRAGHCCATSRKSAGSSAPCDLTSCRQRSLEIEVPAPRCGNLSRRGPGQRGAATSERPFSGWPSGGAE